MSKGYDSAERESRERRQEARLCEAYACLELAAVTIHGRSYCEAHRPPDKVFSAATDAPSE